MKIVHDVIAEIRLFKLCCFFVSVTPMCKGFTKAYHYGGSVTERSLPMQVTTKRRARTGRLGGSKYDRDKCHVRFGRDNSMRQHPRQGKGTPVISINRH